MKRETNPDGSPRRKKTYGGASIERITVNDAPGGGAHINCYIAFEEALKLHLGLGQILGHLNGYDRSTKAGKRTAVCLYIRKRGRRISIVESRIGRKSRPANEEAHGETGE